MSHHLPECFLSNPCRNKEGHSIITVVGGVPLGRDLCEACMADCICYRLRKAEQRVRNETARGIYDHLFNKGAAYQWPNVLNTIRDWAENNGLEDPK